MIKKNRSYHTLRDFFFVIFKHKTLIVLFFLLAVASATIASFLMAPVYEASSKLLVNDNDREAVSFPERKESIVDTAVEILTGRHLTERIIKEFGIITIYPEIKSETFIGQLSPTDQSILKFQEHLTVTRSNLICVAFQHSKPELAAKVVNKIVEEFLVSYRSVQMQPQKYNFFKEQVDLMHTKLDGSQQELGLFRNQNNISSIQKQKSLLLLQVSDLELESAKTQAEISLLESIAKRLKQPAAALTDTRQNLLALKSKDKKLTQQTTRYRLELNRLNKAETRLRELERQVELDEENYLLYVKKLEEARISNAKDEQKLINFSIIEPALPPINPIKPQKLLIVLAAVVLGAAGGLLLAFVSEYFTHTFDDREDIERVLNCPEVASFADLNQEEMGMALQYKTPEIILEESSRIKHYFAMTFPDKKNKIILFCGSQAREGTSTVLFNFAVTLAKEGQKVLAVDANMRTPCLHTLFNVEGKGGLADVVIGNTPVENALKNTLVEHLTVVTSGLQQSNPSALFQNESFDAFLLEVTSRADWVLLDSPPINAYNDACLIASQVDAALMIVKAGKTRWEVSHSGFNRIKRCKQAWSDANILGAVLNRRKKYIPDWLYKRL